MASQRRLIEDIPGIGKLKISKKNPEIYYLEVCLEHKSRAGKFHCYDLRELRLARLQDVIQNWLTPAYDAAMRGERDPWSLIYFKEEPLRIALDICYKELARRAEKI